MNKEIKSAEVISNISKWNGKRQMLNEVMRFIIDNNTYLNKQIIIDFLLEKSNQLQLENETEKYT